MDRGGSIRVRCTRAVIDMLLLLYNERVAHLSLLNSFKMGAAGSIAAARKERFQLCACSSQPRTLLRRCAPVCMCLLTHASRCACREYGDGARSAARVGGLL